MLVSNLYDKNLFRRSEYHRRRNLDLIVNAIKRISDLNIAVNKRDDIVIDDLHKVRVYMTGIFYSSFTLQWGWLVAPLLPSFMVCCHVATFLALSGAS